MGSNSRLVENNNTARIEVLRGGGRACRRPETEGNVRHTKDHNTLVLGRVLGDAAQVGLDNVVTVQEGKLAGGLDPDLGLAVDHTSDSASRRQS